MTKQGSDANIDDLFLFAHQDDEFAAIHLIEAGVRDGRQQRFAFLTNGAIKGGPDSEIRNKETRRALGHIGVGEENIDFLGTAYDLPDGALFQHLPRALDHLDEAIATRSIGRIIVPAWEGGHHDHDAVHLIGLALARRRNCLDHCVQLPFYRATSGFPGIALFAPLAENGTPIAHKRTVTEIAAHLALSRFYPTQARHFAGILPLTLLHHLIDRNLYSQPVHPERVLQRPASRIKYEGRHQLSYSDFEAATRDFIATEILDEDGAV